MTDETTAVERRIVTCGDCGTPVLALEGRDELVLVGPEGADFPIRGGSSFSRLGLAG